MKKILRSAGMPEEIVEQVSQVVHTCRICRRWERHSPKSQVSMRLADRFNEAVQFDLIEYTEDGAEYYIIHLLDEATRFSTADIVSGKDVGELLDAFYFLWIRTFGPMGLLVTDQEGAIKSHEFGSFLAKNNISVKFKPNTVLF